MHAFEDETAFVVGPRLALGLGRVEVEALIQHHLKVRREQARGEFETAHFDIRDGAAVMLPEDAAAELGEMPAIARRILCLRGLGALLRNTQDRLGRLDLG
jgi:hypothetical protein